MKLYAVGLLASKTLKIPVRVDGAQFGIDDFVREASVTTNACQATSVTAKDDEEAVLKARLLIKGAFPESDGWENHSVHINPVPDVQIWRYIEAKEAEDEPSGE